MKTSQITIEKNVYDLNKTGNRQKVELTNGKLVDKVKKQKFTVDALQFNNGLLLIPEYPGKDKVDKYKSLSAKLTGEFTYLIHEDIKKEYKFMGCGRGANFAYYISAKNNIEGLINYLQSIKTDKSWENEVAKNHPRSELAKDANKDKPKGKAVKKVAAKGDQIEAEIFASNNQGKIDAIMKLNIDDDKKAELIVSLS